jgi:hypothetical protein
MRDEQRRRVRTEPDGQRRHHAYVAIFRFGKIQPSSPSDRLASASRSVTIRRDKRDGTAPGAMLVASTQGPVSSLVLMVELTDQARATHEEVAKRLRAREPRGA